MNIVAIVQARMGSSRLPGKVMAALCPCLRAPGEEQCGTAEHTVLARIIARLRGCETVDRVVVATTVEHRDDILEMLAARVGAGCFRGSEQDVLGRYVGAAREAKADIVVRITADCPLLDAGIVDRVVRSLRASRYDWASNAVIRTFPAGLDVEVLWFETLLRLDRRASTPQDREHVTWGAYRTESQLYLMRLVKDDMDNSDLRWTLDTKADLEHIRSIYDDVDYRVLINRVRAKRVA